MKRPCCDPMFREFFPGLILQGHECGLTARRAQIRTDCTVGNRGLTVQWALWTDCTVGTNSD
eukprot:3657588-Lingulodinium_polyedra.AAC.1